jgi:hypothetical protein
LEQIETILFRRNPILTYILFFVIPTELGSAFFITRVHLKGSFGPEFNGCASPKTELSANGEAKWATHVRRFLVLTIPSENPRS